MHTAKLFKNGGSQSVRLPKEFRLPGDRVRISKRGNRIILEPIEPGYASAIEALSQFSDDMFRQGRRQPRMQRRKGL